MTSAANIYGLFDPRSPDVVMYVGKGSEKRAQFHWKRFLAKGTAVNALLRRWFERLRADGFEPVWRFLEEDVADWQAAERRWISGCRLMNTELCNIANGGNMPFLSAEEKSKACQHAAIAMHKLHPGLARNNAKKRNVLYPDILRRAGKIGGFKVGSCWGRKVHELHPEQAAEQGRKNAEKPGFLSRIGSIGGKRGGGIVGRKNAEKPGFLAQIGTKGRHNRWHVARNSFNSECSLCSMTR